VVGIVDGHATFQGDNKLFVVIVVNINLFGYGFSVEIANVLKKVD
jgi:hypothetical protein